MMMMIYYAVDCKIIFEPSMNGRVFPNIFSSPTPTVLNIMKKNYWDLDIASLKSRPFTHYLPELF